MKRAIQPAVAAAIIALLPGVVSAHASGDQAVATGRISGRVTDRRGEPLRNRHAQPWSAGSKETHVIASTDQDGVFTFAVVVAGSYDIVLEVPGFRRLTAPVAVTDGSSVDIGTVVLEAAPLEEHDDITSWTEAKRCQLQGRYANVDYGFSVDIPAGVVGEGAAPPNPNHGFAIEFGEKSVV
jgi:hypothetical protein